MSDSYYSSNSDNYPTSRQKEYKAPTYTDFSSSSYTYDSDSSYKKYDDYSSFSNEDSNRKSQEPIYKQQRAPVYSQQRAPIYGQERAPVYGQQRPPVYKQQSSSSNYDYQSNGNFSQPQYQQTSSNYEYQPTQERQLQNNLSNFNQIPGDALPKKPLDRYTVRDVLQLSLSRQQYLKTLPAQNLRIEPEYAALMKRPGVVLGIADYYEKIIPDTEFNSQVRYIKKGKEIKEALWITSMIGYLALTGSLQRPNSTFKGVFKSRYHLLIPVGLTALMLLDNRNTRVKTKNLVNDRKNTQNIDIALKKFLCDTTPKERVQIFGQS